MPVGAVNIKPNWGKEIVKAIKSHMVNSTALCQIYLRIGTPKTLKLVGQSVLMPEFLAYFNLRDVRAKTSAATPRRVATTQVQPTTCPSPRCFKVRGCMVLYKVVRPNWTYAKNEPLRVKTVVVIGKILKRQRWRERSRRQVWYRCGQEAVRDIEMPDPNRNHEELTTNPTSSTDVLVIQMAFSSIEPVPAYLVNDGKQGRCLVK